MLTIWGRLSSNNVKKVVWLADELGLGYERHDVGLQFGMDDDHIARNPNALIPTIDDDGFVLWESNAILRYLAAKYAPPSMWPADPAARAVADRWMDWQIGYAAAQVPAFLNLVRKPPDQRDAAAVAASAQKTSQMMPVLDRYLAETPWLSGAEFGVGDVPMGVYAHVWFSLDIPRVSVPHVEDWYRRLQQRPCYAATVMVPLS